MIIIIMIKDKIMETIITTTETIITMKIIHKEPIFVKFMYLFYCQERQDEVTNKITQQNTFLFFNNITCIDRNSTELSTKFHLFISSNYLYFA